MLQSPHIQFIPLTTFTTCSRRGQIGGLIFSADWKLRVDHQNVRSNQNICSLNCVVTTWVKYDYNGFISTNIPPTTEFNVRDRKIRVPLTLTEKDECNEDEGGRGRAPRSLSRGMDVLECCDKTSKHDIAQVETVRAELASASLE